ncbi:hypothetical protein ABT127_16835 [Streptomyces sp. NPDC001904]|uniref:hypothetical protein n=1 Tax=Streptomyces sp. NPDC001904 TaxID=3154531 RepID=UPI003330F7ED
MYGGMACDGQGYIGGAQLVRVQICTTRWAYGSPDGSLVQGAGKELLALKHDDTGWREENFGGDGLPAYLVSLDPATGAESEIASYGHLDDALGHSSWAMPYWHDGTLFLASVGNTDKAFKGVKSDDQHESALLKMGG